MGLALEKIFEGTGFFTEHGNHSLDLLDGGEIVRRYATGSLERADE